MTLLPRPVILLLSTLALCAPLRAGLIGTDQERKIGRQVADELEKKYGLVGRDAMVQKVQTVGAKVAFFAKQDRPKVEYQFNVLADKSINALACPGGYMYAFRGLVKKMPEEELLAAVLAHECAHVSERHGMETLERSLGLSVLLGIFAGGQSDLGGAALGILMRGYSRDQEAEADKIGHIYLYQAGYDVGAMARMMERLSELTEDGGGVPNFLRTHPSDESRIRAARAREAEILLDLGSKNPPDIPPRLAVVYQPVGGEAAEVTAVGEGLATQLAQMLTGCGQFRAEFAGTRATGEADRVAALARLAGEQGLDGAIGLSFAEPPLKTEGAGRSASVRIKLSTTMTVVPASGMQAELTYPYATKEEKRDADEQKKIEETIKAKIDETARALAVAVLRPQAVQP
jgi:Zn-dependent protease with chaperone function